MLWRYADVATNCNCLQLKTGYMFDLQNGLLTQKSHTPVMSSANPNLPPCWDPVCLLAVKLTFQHNISPPFHTHCRPGSDSRGSKKKKTFYNCEQIVCVWAESTLACTWTGNEKQKPEVSQRRKRQPFLCYSRETIRFDERHLGNLFSFYGPRYFPKQKFTM